MESVATASPVTPPSKRIVKLPENRDEQLSDWETNDKEVAIRPEDVAKIDTNACSPVSNDSHIASPEPLYQKSRTPSPTPATPIKPPSRESPHTPPPKSKNLNHYSPLEIIDIPDKDSSISPEPLEPWGPSRRSPPPVRNPSPEVISVHSYSSHMRSSMSPPRRHRDDRDMMRHRRHRKERDRDRGKERKRTRSRSPMRKRISRSPSWSRRHYSRSPNRNHSSKKYGSRSPKNVKDRDRDRNVHKHNKVRSPSPHSIRYFVLLFFLLEKYRVLLCF